MAWATSRHTGQNQLRAAVRRALGVTVQADPVSDAQSWLSGTGDMLRAGVRGEVSLAVRLGVLAHADIQRLTDLGRLRRRGSVRRAWGTEMAALAGDIAQQAGTDQGLAELQRRVLWPLELEVLAGQAVFTSASSLIDYVRARLPVADSVTPRLGDPG